MNIFDSIPNALMDEEEENIRLYLVGFVALFISLVGMLLFINVPSPGFYLLYGYSIMGFILSLVLLAELLTIILGIITGNKKYVEKPLLVRIGFYTTIILGFTLLVFDVGGVISMLNYTTDFCKVYNCVFGFGIMLTLLIDVLVYVAVIFTLIWGIIRDEI